MKGGNKVEILFLVGGVIIGIFLTILILRKEPIGTLRVDYSDPDSGPYLFLEIPQRNSHLITQKKTVTFKVDLTQK